MYTDDTAKSATKSDTAANSVDSGSRRKRKVRKTDTENGVTGSLKLPPLSTNDGLTTGETTQSNDSVQQGKSRRKKKARLHEDYLEDDVDDSHKSDVAEQVRARRRRHKLSADMDSGTSSKAKPKRHKLKPPVGDSRQELVSDDRAEEVDEQPRQGRRKRKKRKRDASPEDKEKDDEEEEDSELNMFKEDIVEGDEPVGQSEVDLGAMRGIQGVRSEAGDRLFIEKRTGFKSQNKVKLQQILAQKDLSAARAREVGAGATTLQDVVLGSNHAFRTWGHFCLGLLAGYGLWHVVTVLTLSLGLTWLKFLEVYTDLSLPSQCLYFFLLATATVSTLDRYDVARPSRACMLRSCTLQSGGIAALFCFISLITSLAMASMDDRIGLFDETDSEENEYLWRDENGDLLHHRELQIWRVLNCVRGIFAILAWLVVSLRPSTDRLHENLKSGAPTLVAPPEYQETIAMDAKTSRV